jgi:hypothetical protein
MSSELGVVGARARLGRRIVGVFAAMSLLLGGTALTAAARADRPALPVTPGTRLLPGLMPKTDAVTNASAPAGSHLNYYGGKVISNVHVTQVLYGSGTFTPEVSGTGASTLAAFYAGVTNSAHFDWLNEYNTTRNAANGQPGSNQVIGRGSFVGQRRITPSLTNNLGTIDDSNIQAELKAQINAGHLPRPDANTLFAVYFPKNKTITNGASSSGVQFCAYHGTVAASGSLPEFYYSVLPDFTTGGMSVGCGGGTQYQNESSVSSHELVEAVTDPEVGLSTANNAPPLAWYDTTNGEIGDICNAQQGTVTGGDGVTYTVQKEFSNQANDCIVTRNTGANDFSIAASPSSATVTAGGSATSTITTTVTSGAAQTVSLSASGLPAGASATFNPTSVNSGGSSTLTLSTASSTPAGTYPITVTGAGTSATHTTSVSLTVNAPAANDFSIAASPSSATVTAGSPATSTISTAVTSGSAQSVSLSASGLPTGATASFNPTSVNSGGSSTLTVGTSTMTPSGTYAVTVTGTGASATHTTTFTLTVNGSAPSGIVNGGFETGSFSSWTRLGTTSIVTTPHTGSYAAQGGSTSATNGDSSITQTFTAPAGATTLSFWYKMTCPDSLTYDWATATLKDNTASTTTTPLAKTCATNSAYVQKSVSIVGGHSYTLTLTSHDDNYAGDASYTKFDDVVVS